MHDPDRSFVVAVYGLRPSFHPAAGPMMALVEVDGGPEQVLVDRERDRCRVGRTPARRDLDKWCSPAGLVLGARRRVWGLSIVEDRYAGEGGGDGPAPCARSSRPRAGSGRPPREVVPSSLRFVPARLPRDLCSCMRCRDLVIVRRCRSGRRGYLVELGAPGRLYRRAVRLLGGLVGCQGPGTACVRHGHDCPAFRLAEAGPIPSGRRSRDRMLVQLLGRLRLDPVGRSLAGGGAH